MASIVNEEEDIQNPPGDIRQYGKLAEDLVQYADDFFKVRLRAFWNRVSLTWEARNNTVIDQALRTVIDQALRDSGLTMFDYFVQEPFTHGNVRFSPRLRAFIASRVAFPQGVTFDTDVNTDYRTDPRTEDYSDYVEKIKLSELVQRRFIRRLEVEEIETQADDPARYTLPVVTRAPTTATDRDYYEDTGFESVDLIEQELKKIYRHGLEPVVRLTVEDKRDIQRHRNALVEVNNGLYEQGQIREVDVKKQQQQDVIDFINAHEGKTEHQVVLQLKVTDSGPGQLNEDEQEFLNKYCKDNDYNDWCDAFEGAKEEVEDEDDPQTGEAVRANSLEEIKTLQEEKALLQSQAIKEEEVGFMLDDFVTVEQRTYIGAYAIDEAHQLNDMIEGILESNARKLNDPNIHRLQNKLRFATAFYEGINQIFDSDDTVPPTNEWRADNYRSPLVGYVVWGMSHRQPGVDKLLFKPQATYVRRLIRTGALPSVREVQYMILTDRLGRNLSQDILEVTKEQGGAYKNSLLGISPKRDKKPAALPGTVERQTRGRSLTSKRANQTVAKKQKHYTQPRINTMPGMRSSKAHTLQGPPPPMGDGKVRTRSRTPVRRGGSSSNSMDTGEMLNKLNLKF